MQKAKLSLIAAALLVPAFALSAYAADFVRPMPTHPIQAGPTLLGGEQPVICSPLVGKNLKAIKAEAKTVKALNDFQNTEHSSPCYKACSATHS